MARFLAIDGDHPQLQVAAATLVRGTVRIDKAITIPEAQPVTLANAAAMGKLLKEHLRESGITPGPVLVSIGRDRIIVKDVKYPPVPVVEEANVIRFQVLKELTESPDSVVVDYFPIPNADSPTERKAISVVMRKEILEAFQTLCHAAGLKLVAVTPRPFASFAGLQRAIATGAVNPFENPNASVAILTRGDKWGELTIARGGNIVFSRSLSGPGLSSETGLLGELKRNFTVYAGQNPQFPVQVLYVPEAQTVGSWSGRLAAGLTIPVLAYDPLEGVMHDSPPETRGAFASLVGLVGLQAQGSLPINFASPREPKPPVDPKKQLLKTLGPVLVLILLSGFAFLWSVKSGKDSQLTVLVARKIQLEQDAKKLDPDGKRVKALEDWERRRINWLDEIYDLAQRFPDPKGTQITELKALPFAADKNNKMKAVAQMVLTVQTENGAAVESLVNEIKRDRAYTVLKETKGGTSSSSSRFNQHFELKINMEKRPVKSYVRTIKESPVPRTKPSEWEDSTSGGFSDAFDARFGGP